MYTLRFLSLGLVTILLVSTQYACGIKLSENEAQTLIEEKLVLPKKTWLKLKIPIFDFDPASKSYIISNAAVGVQELIANNYVTPKSRYMNSDFYGRDVTSLFPYRYYNPTDKGKFNLNEFNVGGMFHDKFLYIKSAIFTEVFNRIEETLIDYDNKTAKVRFTTRFEPIEPYHSLLHRERTSQKAPGPFGFDNHVHFTNERVYLHEALFKKYDQGGWRIESAPTDTETEGLLCSACKKWSGLFRTQN